MSETIYEADDHMLDLLQEMKETRDVLAAAAPRFVDAMKRWAAFSKATTDETILAMDSILTVHGVGDLPERAVDAWFAQKRNHDAQAMWRSLVETSEAYYTARIRARNAQTKVLGYIQYLQDRGEFGERHVVPDMLLESMEQGIEGGAIFR